MAEAIYVDGTALDPTDFAEYNDDGVWVPKAYSGSFGSDGFHLTFDSSQTNGIGHDSSGNGNDFTASGFDTTAISSSNEDNDIDYEDTPTSNYGTWNPLHTAEGNKGSFTDANLQTANGSGGDYITPSTIACGDGHWYWEVRVDGVQSTGYPMIGILDYESAKPEHGGGTSNTEGCLYWTTGEFGAFVSQGSQSSYGATFTTGDIIGVEYNGSNGQLTFYKNGTSQGLATTVAASRRENMIPGVSAGNNGSAEVSVNFGQMDFIHTVPTGAKKLQTNNLIEPTIKNGKEHFETVTWSGNGTSPRTIATEFQPDLVWIKGRSNATSHFLYDSVRGFGNSNELSSDTTNSEGSSPPNVAANGYVSGVTSSGFTLTTGTSGDNYTNDSSRTYVGWCWKAGGNSDTFNVDGTGYSTASAAGITDGTISLTGCSVNTEAGFSIVGYEGNATTNQTVAHGLTQAPELVFYKERDASNNWYVYHDSLEKTGGYYYYVKLNNTAAQTTAAGGITDKPDASVLKINDVQMTNPSTGGISRSMIAYCWHSVEGFSKFGTYTGNGSTDGPFVYLGFKPALLVIRSLAGRPWMVYDNARNTNNPLDNQLYWDSNNIENATDSGTSNILDFLSNGFKLRDNSGQTNASSEEYVFMAWAENPFGGENAPPATAR